MCYGLGDFIIKLFSSLFEFTHSLSKTACQFRQFLRPEEDLILLLFSMCEVQKPVASQLTPDAQNVLSRLR